MKEIKDAILTLLKNGHDVGSVSTCMVYVTDHEGPVYFVEVYDPLTEEGKQLYDEGPVAEFIKNHFNREGESDYVYKEVSSPEEAASLYLDVFTEMNKPE